MSKGIADPPLSAKRSLILSHWSRLFFMAGTYSSFHLQKRKQSHSVLRHHSKKMRLRKHVRRCACESMYVVHSAERADVLACMQRADAVACMHAARSARRCVCESMYVEACFMQVVLRSLRSHVHAWRIAQPCCSVSDARARLHGCAGIPGR